MRTSIGAAMVMLGLGLAGCAEDPCILDVCPVAENTIAYPGPCRSTGAGDGQDSRTDFTYDPATSELSSIMRDYHSGDIGGPAEARLEWAADGSLARLTIPRQSEVWVLGPTEVLVGVAPPVDFHTRYDRATFAFRPMAWAAMTSPQADLGIIEDQYTTYTWTTEDGWLLKHGTARETGALLTPVWYLLDAQGRVVAEKTHDAGGEISSEAHYEYVGAVLSREWRDSENPIHQHWETSYEYDAGGNLIETRDEDGFREVYTYDCW